MGTGRKQTLGYLLFLSCLVIAAPGLSAQEQSDPPFTFLLPPGLALTDFTPSINGSTYTYTSTNQNDLLRLMITVMPRQAIDQRFGALSEVQCINLFVTELRTNHDDFFAVNQSRPLTLAGREFPQFRWSGKNAGVRWTGILSCGTVSDWYLVVHFVDETLRAARTFPPVRTSLRDLRPTQR